MKLKIVILSSLFLLILNINAQTTDLKSSLNSYSFDLYREIKADDENLFFSPLSTYLALMIAYEGAYANTKNEFEKVLYINNPDLLNNFEGFYSDLVTCKDSSNLINISNAIWIQNKLKIENTYRANIQKKYNADLRTVDFIKKQETASEMNSWVSEKTNKLIRNIMSPNDIDENTKLVISNAIYFKGKWAKIFDRNSTKPDDFYTISEEIVKTDFMNQVESFIYFENNEFQFVSIPYKGDDKSFCIILPKKRYGMNEVENVLDQVLLDKIFSNIEHPRVILSIPKFKLETNYSLNRPLMDLGIKTAFTSKANFSGITTEEPIMINRINHKAYIEIDEEKTEATAATVIAFATGQAIMPETEPKIFKADHPFIFFIMDNKTKSIIFIGRFTKP